MTCRHCGGGPVNRPRGLCWSCYYTPGVRDLYPPTSKYARRAGRRDGVGEAAEGGLTDAEILALPAQPFGDEEPPPPPYEPEPDPPKVGDWADQWARAAAAGYELTADTEPGAIAAAQRADVAEARARLGPDAAAIAADVLLPVWTVRRRLAELGHGTQEGAA